MWTGAGGQCVEWVYSLWVHVDGCWGTVCGVGVPPLGACGRVLGDSVWSGCTPFGYMWTGAGGQCVEWVYSLWVHVDGCWGTVCGVGVPPLGACGRVLGDSMWSGCPPFGCLWMECWGSVCGSGCLLWMSVDKLSPENFGVFHYVEATCFS